MTDKRLESCPECGTKRTAGRGATNTGLPKHQPWIEQEYQPLSSDSGRTSSAQACREGTVESVVEEFAVIAAEPEFEVSPSGVVRRRVDRSGLKAGRVSAQSKNKRGYPVVRLRGRPYYVHRLVVAAHGGGIPDGMTIDHIDGDKTNNHVSNLEAVSAAENMRRAIETGLHTNALSAETVERIRRLRRKGATYDEITEETGVSRKAASRICRGKHRLAKSPIEGGAEIRKNYARKLSEECVREIRRDTRLTQAELAEKFGVTQSNISAVLKRRTWKDVQSATAPPSGSMNLPGKPIGGLAARLVAKAREARQ